MCRHIWCGFCLDIFEHLTRKLKKKKKKSQSTTNRQLDNIKKKKLPKLPVNQATHHGITNTLFRYQGETFVVERL